MFDFLIVGCGLSGAACARLLAEKGKRVLILEKRNHVAGNVYDEYNDEGILVHTYGPHIFHTKYKEVWDFLSRFTTWQEYQHRVKAYVNGMLVPMPINLDTINTLYGTSYTVHNIEEFYASVLSASGPITNARDMVVSKVGPELYELFFKNYTKKQWDIDAEDLDKEVTERIPIRYNRDDRYFTDPYQGMPQRGYTNMVKKMLDYKGIQVMLNADYHEIHGEVSYDYLIYTGPIDRFFDYRFGPLPYRSLRFDFQTIETEYYQPCAVVNYPNDYDFTRITEFKRLTGQKAVRTTIIKEYSSANGEPYYPIPQPENKILYKQYLEEANKLKKVFFLGRLGQYKYANMDVVIKDAMELIEKIAQ